MKLVKRISFFFIVPVSIFALGFYSNMKLQEFFYPNKYQPKGQEQVELEQNGTEQVQVIPTAVENEQIISADTSYVIEEMDLEDSTAVETKWSMPDQYIGMNRVRFIKEMQVYQASPSLKDQELGLVSVEVVSFSSDKVVIRKNYIFKEVSTSFYLVNEKNFVVVYSDDMKTVFMQTNISLDSLPDTLKQEIIRNKFIATEEELYNFLESYSS